MAAASVKDSRSIREHRGQRNPRKIQIENFVSNDLKKDNKKSIRFLSSKNDGSVNEKTSTTVADEAGESIDTASDNNDQQLATTTTTTTTTTTECESEDKPFFSGNPFVECTQGIIHIYKKNGRVEMTEGLSNTLCLFAVPATLNCHDLLNFVAPCHPVIYHIRIIRDGTPNQFMVLLEFRSAKSAWEFYQTFNGVAYNSLEPDSLCHAVWVSSVEWGFDGLPPLGHTELPTCPVCLERMDESVDGILTILCNHAFHANCLIKWGDSSCPVCRCVQTPELAESSVCMECEDTEGLWICLICGHVGCGRYQGGHAATHFRSTNHTYALQLGSNRVWDYAGDNFVHRLLQSKTDGKLVATEYPGNGDGDEKIDGIQLEFTYLLTSQLDAQRNYYEERLIKLETMVETENRNREMTNDKLLTKCNELENKLQLLTKEKSTIEKKHAHLYTKVTSLIKDLSDERQMNKALQSNQTSWIAKYNGLEAEYKNFCTEKDSEVAELKDELRDLMFYMEAKNTIANSDIKNEIESSSVVIPDPPIPATSSSSTTAAASSSSSSQNSSAKSKNRRQKRK